MNAIYGLTKSELTQDFSTQEANAIYRGLYRTFPFKAETYIQGSKSLTKLKTSYRYCDLKILQVQQSQDGSIKFLLWLEDGKSIESVLLPFYQRQTVCLSTQVGCSVGCPFCYTGKMGLKRNLNSSEIVAQIITIKKWLYLNQKTDKIHRLVFMGQGEPLHNFEALKQAINIFTDRHGLGFGKRGITISTSGHLPTLKRFNELEGVNLAISLHASTNEKRDQLVPLNKRYPLEDLMQEIGKIKLKKRQYIMWEYLLIDGVNDSIEDANRLISLLKVENSIINLIRYNPTDHDIYQRPTEEKVQNFRAVLQKSGFKVMIRESKGLDIKGACGQLVTNC